MNPPEDLVRRLISLSARRFSVDDKHLKPEDDLFDKLGIDSMQALDLLSELEDAFEVEIPDYELQGVHSFSALAAVIAERL